MAKNTQLSYDVGDTVVYPAHGVGRVIGKEKTTFDGEALEFYVINFEGERMELRVPVERADSSGLRKLSSRERMKKAVTILQGTPKSKKAMWSRRAQEYESKINSGDPVSIAEVLRDLRRDEGSEPSYSEKQIYQTAFERFVREYAEVEALEPDKAVCKIEEIINAA
ncbi:MAG: CarD family transcriptional regulator [Alphaproteobacteria bacterium GM202ARS2]|nr:CarD family transcriptional regulator [Alphaproteobacteria bacterium GM202ARS2]